MEKPKGKRPMGRPRLRWKDNIEMDLQEVRYGGMDCMNTALNRDGRRALLNAAMNFLVQLNVGSS